MNSRTESSSLAKKVLAGIVLLVIAWIVLKLAVGLFAGLVATVFWVAVVAVLVVGAVWAAKTLL